MHHNMKLPSAVQIVLMTRMTHFSKHVLLRPMSRPLINSQIAPSADVKLRLSLSMTTNIIRRLSQKAESIQLTTASAVKPTIETVKSITVWIFCGLARIGRSKIQQKVTMSSVMISAISRQSTGGSSIATVTMSTNRIQMTKLLVREAYPLLLQMSVAILLLQEMILTL